MKQVLIDCTKMVDEASVHDAFSEALEFPAYYGRTLDALYDMLSSSPELKLTLTNVSALKKLFRYGDNLKLALEDAAKDNDLLILEYQE